MTEPRRIDRISLNRLIQRMDNQPAGETAEDTVPTGFASVDRVLGGGMRHRDLIVLGGDVGSGKSALALGMALRAAATGATVVYLSGEMDEDRLFERALAIEGRTPIDAMRSASLKEETRASVGAVALRIQELPLHIHPLVGRKFDEALAPAWQHNPQLVVVNRIDLALGCLHCCRTQP